VALSLAHQADSAFRPAELDKQVGRRGNPGAHVQRVAAWCVLHGYWASWLSPCRIAHALYHGGRSGPGSAPASSETLPTSSAWCCQLRAAPSRRAGRIDRVFEPAGADVAVHSRGPDVPGTGGAANDRPGMPSQVPCRRPRSGSDSFGSWMTGSHPTTVQSGSPLAGSPAAAPMALNAPHRLGRFDFLLGGSDG
jgi:hypothetical protein